MAAGGIGGGSTNLIIMVFFWNKIFSDLASSLALNFIMCKFLFFIILFYFIFDSLIHWINDFFALISFFFFFFFIIILLYYVIISFSALIALLTEESGDYLCLARNYLYANTVLIKHCVKRVQIRSFFWSVFSRI